MIKTIAIEQNAANRNNNDVNFIYKKLLLYYELSEILIVILIALIRNSQHTTPQVLNLPKEKSLASDSLTDRAIQAFVDTEDEWAEVYANLAES